jgi:hypothetical protein
MNRSLPLLIVLALALAALASCELNDGPRDRDVFLGPWDVTDRCLNDTQDYRLDIFEDGGFGEDISLEGDGLYRIGFVLEATVTGSRFVIPVQDAIISTVPDLRYEFAGSGSISSDGQELSIDYDVLTLQDGLIIDADQCRLTGSPRP